MIMNRWLIGLSMVLLFFWIVSHVQAKSEKSVQIGTDGVVLEFVWIPKGCFQMGSNSGNSDEKPVHKICVDGFWIGKYEVTQAQWEVIVGNNPSNFKVCGGNCPVESVSWDDVQSFIQTLNSKVKQTFRLPKEAEWEYAARSGGKNELYSGGKEINNLAWHYKNSKKTTHKAGTKSANGLGIYDMSGNVWEWCQDWYDSDYYKTSPANNPTGPSFGSERVPRGGSWRESERYCKVTTRTRYRPSENSTNLGFRLIFVP